MIYLFILSKISVNKYRDVTITLVNYSIGTAGKLCLYKIRAESI
jgi:hypothetical protein